MSGPEELSADSRAEVGEWLAHHRRERDQARRERRYLDAFVHRYWVRLWQRFL